MMMSHSELASVIVLTERQAMMVTHYDIEGDDEEDLDPLASGD